ncbi:hypothetical protein OQZ55_03965 [Bacillus subtilis]|uniref:hypothetical protein n=1 Tax=Bacillus TaxID=1386 RepID=UPI000CDDC0EB|nr:MULTISPECIES: hypothetical protein [Bacillus]MCT6514740.1 hypothetical protein [Bacillus subtilis]MCX4075401.1 hypothetical protein [Bacillus subtilis]MEC0395506.1 hypothetical protein [Bacillus subtilis]POX31838.1 hypothetical protein C3465_21120 [Bacillus sp. Ru63]WRS92282.1 hypothetical protein VDS57_13355 [Bacillus subtilis]
MKKDVNSIIKEVAERYGLIYDENKTEHSILNSDGSIKYIEDKDLYEALGIPKRVENWTSVPEEKSIQWSNNKNNSYVFSFSDESYDFRVKNEKIVA